VSAAGRIVAIDDERRVVTLDPAGSDVRVLAAGGPTLHVQLPTWSPDARRVAWIEVQGSGDALESRLVTSRPDGAERTAAVIDGPAFFLHWDPVGERVAYLAPHAHDGIALGVVDVADGGAYATPLTTGQPFYFDWAPDGRRLFTHVGEERLGYLALDGAAEALPARSGEFRAPQWGAGGRLLYAVRDGGGGRLVEREAGGAERAHVAFEGLIAFALAPGGGRLAYHVRPAASATAAAGDEPGDAAPLRAAAGALSVLDLATGATERVADDPVIAFCWSPDGARLRVLGAEQTPAGFLGRWSVWDEAGSLRLGAFAPRPEYGRGCLPFFDQFARAQCEWSPDGSQFVYAGVDEAGEQGLWVQSADGALPPIRIGDAVIASWSPR